MQYGNTSALIVVDLQNDFADPSGSLYVRSGEDVIPIANREIRRMKDAGARWSTRKTGIRRARLTSRRTGHLARALCPADLGRRFHPDLLRVEAKTIQSGAEGGDGYSGFTERDPRTGAESDTGLAGYLRARDIETVVVLGLATDYCVRATALDAVRAGFKTIVLREGVRPVELEPGDGERALEEMRGAGVVVQ